MAFSIGSHYRRSYSVRPHWAGSSMRRPVGFRSPEGRMPQPQAPGQGFSRREPFGVGGGARGEIARGGDHIPGVVDPEGESYVPGHQRAAGRYRGLRHPPTLPMGRRVTRSPGRWGGRGQPSSDAGHHRLKTDRSARRQIKGRNPRSYPAAPYDTDPFPGAVTPETVAASVIGFANKYNKYPTARSPSHILFSVPFSQFELIVRPVFPNTHAGRAIAAAHLARAGRQPSPFL